ncbi:MAG: nucleotidyltransferase family protein [Formivibrio sp.]|nr:nucleotidyltransferase family protein [Formivibrio sp.]
MIYPSDKCPWAATPVQKQLLDVVLAPEGYASENGLAWLNSLDIANQQEVLNRLLPMVHERLRSKAVEHPLMEKIKGVRRKVWSRNQLLFKHATPIIQALRDAGIPLMLLKGTAMMTQYYEDTGLRAMGDVDLMVPFNDVDQAIDLLRKNGWKPEIPLPARLTQDMKLCAHAIGFTEPSGLSIDLHWHLLHFCLHPQADRSFWEASEASTFAQRDVRILNPADQLLHLIVHGLVWCVTPTIRWIPDACIVIRKTPGLDWNRLIAEARERKLVLFVRTALNYLAESFAVPIPSQVLHALNSLPVTTRERNEFAAFTQLRLSPFSTPLQIDYSVPLAARLRYYTYRRNAEGAARCGIKLTIFGFLRVHYNKEPTRNWRSTSWNASFAVCG